MLLLDHSLVIHQDVVIQWVGLLTEIEDGHLNILTKVMESLLTGLTGNWMMVLS
jgi:hypothetical protein